MNSEQHHPLHSAGAARAPGTPAPARGIPHGFAEDFETREQRQSKRLRLATQALPDRVDWRAVAIFIAIAFAGAWLIVLPLWLNGQDLMALGQGGMQLLLLGMMFTPTLATLIVVFLVQRPPAPSYLLGLRCRPIPRTLLLLAIAIAIPPVLYLLGCLIAIAAGLSPFDAEGVFLRRAFAQSGVQADGIPLPALVATQLGITLLLTLPMSTLSAFGEELGWRGWLLPNLRPLGTWPALMISGAVWGLWHAPIILLGYNFEDRGPAGVAAMTALCILLGVFLGWLRLRSASVYPAAVAHGSFNSFVVIIFMISGEEGFSQPFANGLGWTQWIPYTLLALLLALCGSFRRQPLPTLTLAESEAVRRQDAAQRNPTAPAV